MVDEKKKCRIAFGIFEADVECPKGIDPDTEEFRDYFKDRFKKGGLKVSNTDAT